MKGYSPNFVRLKNTAMKRSGVLTSFFLLFILCACNGKTPPASATPPEPSPAAPQILAPVKWAWRAVQTGKGEYTLVFTATIDKGWHTYSQFMEQGGPVPTSFTYKENKDVVMLGKPTEKGPKYHEEHSALFDNMLVKYYDESMVTEQKVKVLKDTKLTGAVDFMACDDSRCLPPDEKEFSFDLKGEQSSIGENTDSSHAENIAPKKITEQKREQNTFDSTVQSVITQSLQKDSMQKGAAAVIINDKRFGKPLSDCGEEKPQHLTLWLAILLGFGGGLLALVTPCVFPMIPLTVSFFIKRSESQTKGKFEALMYSFSIVLIYFLLSLPFLVFNISSGTLNEISTGAALNVFFFIIFVVFALSFFGFYEIRLPSFIANKADSASNVGGIVGIFFMAVTLAIVSFSCTGPILGSLLVSSLSGGKLNLAAGMTSFGLALALPFGLFALFPNMMKSLPKSGGWLNSVKVVIGFVELIFAIKFLSNADLVAHWGLLKRELFLGLWAVLGLGAFTYLMGWLKFPHDSGPVKFSPVRLGAALLALLFTGYSAYGIAGNTLSLFSGFPPPKFYSYRVNPSDFSPIKNNYEKALAKAKAENKLVMIDFTGWACVNCRKMEENVWPDPEIRKRLTEKYVIVSLYVDDKMALPQDQQYVSTVLNGLKVNTVGRKFIEMEAKYFGTNAQPYYVLISPDEKLLTNPRGYTPDAQEYATFLDCGYNASKQLSQR